MSYCADDHFCESSPFASRVLRAASERRADVQHVAVSRREPRRKAKEREGEGKRFVRRSQTSSRTYSPTCRRRSAPTRPRRARHVRRNDSFLGPGVNSDSRGSTPPPPFPPRRKYVAFRGCGRSAALSSADPGCGGGVCAPPLLCGSSTMRGPLSLFPSPVGRAP